jgi:hypothetical protein
MILPEANRFPLMFFFVGTRLGPFCFIPTPNFGVGIYLKIDLRYNKMRMNNLLASVNLNIASWELILMLFLAGAGVLLGLAIGKERIFALILGGYISFALISGFSPKKIFPDLFEKEENFVVLIIVFLVLVGLIYFALLRSILRSAIKRKTKSIFQSVFLGILLIGMLISIIFSFFPNDLLAAFTGASKNIFNTTTARFLWMIIPLIFIGIFKGNSLKSKD